MDPRIDRAREIIEREAQAVRQVAEQLGAPFVRALDLILGLRGRVVTAGMGKAAASTPAICCSRSRSPARRRSCS
jgi:D-arabinose 5-phosphate isomerase GutQ